MIRSAVPRRWPGSTLIILGAGPSLCAEDLSLVEQSGLPTIAVNGAGIVAPWADVLVAADRAWWMRNRDLCDRPSLNYMLPHGDPPPYGVIEMETTGQRGIEWDPRAVRTGGHSGYAAINFAVHLGAACVILLGYDMQPAEDGSHHVFHMEHPDGSHLNYASYLPFYAEARDALTQRGIVLWNASRKTAIDSLTRVDLKHALDVAHAFRPALTRRHVA